MTKTDMQKECDDSCDNNCGLFDFMANTIGIKVLHPGGYQATEKLSSLCQLNENSHVLDLACGAGTTSIYLSAKYNCKVSGIDISKNLIDSANKSLEKSDKQHKISFEVADAFNIPYEDNTFDTVIAQAFFILIDKKEKVLDEIYRVLKPGGYIGSLELGWFKTPTKEAFDELVEKACDTMIPRMLKFEEWELFFESKKLTHIKTYKYPMPAGMIKLMKTEGLVNFIGIMLKMMGNKKNRKRMMNVQKTFSKYNDYFGYGLFCFKK